jgi:hypothetical protein
VPKRDGGVKGVGDVELAHRGEDVDSEEGGVGIVLDHRDPPARLV